MVLWLCCLLLCGTEVEPAFPLKDGDRIVLVGDTLFERDQNFGYLETEILRLYPELKLTFRNLGWSADTPAGRSRCYFDPPEAGFRRLVDQIDACQPTVLFIGYGMAHALEVGSAKLFASEMNRLLDAVATPDMRVALVAPIHPERVPEGLPIDRIYASLERYRKTLKRIASERGFAYVSLADLYTKNIFVGYGGFVLKKSGHQTVFAKLAELFHQPDEKHLATIHQAESEEAPLAFLDDLAEKKVVRFKAVANRLPSAVDQYLTSHLDLTSFRLPDGEYEIEIDGYSLTGFVDGDLSRVQRKLPDTDGYFPSPWSRQLEELRELVRQKNSLYFQRYRPQNITYLLGFRAHEQGQNAKEIEQLDPMIAELEAEIDKLRHPKPLQCEIRRVD